MNDLNTVIDDEFINSLDACNERKENYFKNYKGKNFSVIEFIELNKISWHDKFWVLWFNKFLTIPQKKDLCCDFAEHVLPIFEKKFPEDTRPRNAIEIAREKLLYYYTATAAAAADATDATFDALAASADDAAAAANAAANAANAAAYYAPAANAAADAAICAAANAADAAICAAANAVNADSYVASLEKEREYQVRLIVETLKKGGENASTD